jgi:hypothetical protein
VAATGFCAPVSLALSVRRRPSSSARRAVFTARGGVGLSRVGMVSGWGVQGVRRPSWRGAGCPRKLPILSSSPGAGGALSAGVPLPPARSLPLRAGVGGGARPWRRLTDCHANTWPWWQGTSAVHYWTAPGMRRRGRQIGALPPSARGGAAMPLKGLYSLNMPWVMLWVVDRLVNSALVGAIRRTRILPRGRCRSIVAPAMSVAIGG